MKADLKRMVVCLVALTGLVAVAQAQTLIPADGRDTTLLDDVEQTLKNDRPDGTVLLDDVDIEVVPPVPNEPGGRWIGVGVAPIPEVLKSHLNLADGLGVMVDHVVPESPAAQAGLRRHDVLISAGGVAVEGPQSLIDAVGEAKDGSLELKWIRGSQEMVADVIPAKRPGTLRLGTPGRNGPVDPRDLGRLRDWLGRLEHGQPGHGPGRLRMRLMPRGNTRSNQSVFQNNLQVQIERQNDEPAKIKVQKDGDTWELTEDDLGELPPEIRGQVESMLNGGQPGLGGFGDLRGLHGLDGLPDLQRLLDGMDGFQDFEKQMNEQMERLFEEMQQLRSQQRQLIPADELEQDGDQA